MILLGINFIDKNILITKEEIKKNKIFSEFFEMFNYLNYEIRD